MLYLPLPSNNVIVPFQIFISIKCLLKVRDKVRPYGKPEITNNQNDQNDKRLLARGHVGLRLPVETFAAKQNRY